MSGLVKEFSAIYRIVEGDIKTAIEELKEAIDDFIISGRMFEASRVSLTIYKLTKDEHILDRAKQLLENELEMRVTQKAGRFTAKISFMLALLDIERAKEIIENTAVPLTDMSDEFVMLKTILSEEKDIYLSELLSRNEKLLREANDVKKGEIFRIASIFVTFVEGKEKGKGLAEESAKFFEDIGRRYYVNGKLELASNYLREASHSYVLADNVKRARVITNNIVRILKQQGTTYAKYNIARALAGVGYTVESLKYFVESLKEENNYIWRADYRLSALYWEFANGKLDAILPITALTSFSDPHIMICSDYFVKNYVNEQLGEIEKREEEIGVVL